MRYEALPLMPTTWLSLLACRSAGVASESCLSLSLINSSQYIVNTIFCAHSYLVHQFSAAHPLWEDL